MNTQPHATQEVNLTELFRAWNTLRPMLEPLLCNIQPPLTFMRDVADAAETITVLLNEAAALTQRQQERDPMIAQANRQIKEHADAAAASPDGRLLDQMKTVRKVTAADVEAPQSTPHASSEGQPEQPEQPEQPKDE